ncbi:MAG TPA: penicillin-binding protein, partial [Verrucomicrobiae bacterium]|nr:penicillin-binding protein [Verrucomicrobiae bacterium]
MTEFRTTALRSRTLIFAAFVACAFLGILLRIGYLQVFKHEEYSRLAEAQRAKTVPLRPKRGPILDRAGLVLADSAAAESLFGLPTRMSDSARVATKLAPILGEPASDIARRLDPDKRFVW